MAALFEASQNGTASNMVAKVPHISIYGFYHLYKLVQHLWKVLKKVVMNKRVNLIQRGTISCIEESW